MRTPLLTSHLSTTQAHQFKMTSSNNQSVVKSWAVLAPYTSRFQAYHLYNQTTTFGRHPSNDIVFSNVSNSSSSAELNTLSKHHFEIIRKNDSSTLLIDRSFNGTFIDGKLVGKGNESRLENGQKISLSHPNLVCFTFFKFINI